MKYGHLVIPTIVLVVGTALLQYHAIWWWTDHVDETTGWAWSLCLEVAALWLWFRPGLFSRAIGLVGTLLVLAGPLHQVATPVLEDLAKAEHAAQARETQATLLQGRIDDLRTTLDRLTANSRERTGWLPAINRTREDLAAAREEYEKVLASPPAAHPGLAWQEYAVVLLQALGLLVVAVSNVVAVRALRHARDHQLSAAMEPAVLPSDTPEPASDASETPVATTGVTDPKSLSQAESSRHAGANQGGDVEFLARRVSQQLRDAMAAGETVAGLAQRHAVDRSELSRLLHHNELVHCGKRTASRTTIERLARDVLEHDGNLELATS